jgi:nitrile hydratase accessory protein
VSPQPSDLATVDLALGLEAPLPRDNGELVFEEPWHGRALAMAVVTIDRLGLSWDDFRAHLGAAIAAHAAGEQESAATAYYSAWLAALEALLAEHGVLELPG